MTNLNVAAAQLKDARIILEEAKESFEKGHFHRTVRKCQESVELALKGLLKLKGVEYPKSHKIGKVLAGTLAGDVDAVFLSRAVSLSDQLADDREPSFYGSDEAPADELFSVDSARQILEEATFVVAFVAKLVGSDGLGR
ncbi:MAG: HEPN domain-containing protein [Deltaproteobacteria bacterium]|nr:HEPN domain-containing protein [Deltaproteobacteria bacterium]